MTIKPNLNPAAQPWAREVENRLSGVKRAVIQGAVQNNNSAVQAIASTNQRITTVEGATVAAQESAYAAMESANGKNTVFHTVEGDPDPIEAVEGDLLFVHNGTITGTVKRLAVYTSGAWADSPVTNEVIANLDAGKITTGSLNAGLIKVTTDPSGTGQRVEIAATGLSAYNASNQVVTSIDSATGALTSGDATVKGTFRNAPEGAYRTEISATSSTKWGDDPGGLKMVTDSGSTILEVGYNTNYSSPFILNSSGSITWNVPGYRKMEVIGAQGIAIRGGSNGVGIFGGEGSIYIDAGEQTLGLTGSVNFTDTATKQSARNSLELGNYSTWDTGWTVLTSGNWTVRVRRVGPLVELRGIYVGTVASGVTVQTAANFIPADLIPVTYNAPLATFAAQPSAFLTCEVNTVGAVAARNTGTATSGANFRFAGTYFVG